jgi:flagellin
MRINTNVSSLTAQDAAQNTSKSITSSLEKLSTGLRINKASDDASGLAIADKLRTQSTSINQGISNGNSAVALLQIADKSMGEQSNILDTIKAKLIQANTDTTSNDGREAIRKDISKLLTQLDNVAAQTNYNGTSLLADVKNGALTGKEAAALNFQIGADNSNIISTKAINSTAAALGGGDSVLSTVKANTNEMVKNLPNGTLTVGGGGAVDATVSGDLGEITAKTVDLSIVVDPADTELISKLKDLEVTGEFEQDSTYDNVFSLTLAKSVDLSGINLDNAKISMAATGTFTSDSSSFKIGNNDLVNDLDISVSQDLTEGAKTTVTSQNTTDMLTVAGQASSGTALDINVTGDLGVLKAGATAVTIDTTNAKDIAALQKIIDDGNTDLARTDQDTFTLTASKSIDLTGVVLTDANIKSTIAAGATAFTSSSSESVTISNNSGTTNVTLTNVDASSSENLATLRDLGEGELTQQVASDFQSVVDDAITKLNGYRGEIGSTQNQVESAVRNLMTQATNVKAAESIIRDVDYAAESANFNKQNIISQAGSYAISQANSVQQNVLKLLQ